MIPFQIFQDLLKVPQTVVQIPERGIYSYVPVEELVKYYPVSCRLIKTYCQFPDTLDAAFYYMQLTMAIEENKRKCVGELRAWLETEKSLATLAQKKEFFNRELSKYTDHYNQRLSYFNEVKHLLIASEKEILYDIMETENDVLYSKQMVLFLAQVKPSEVDNNTSKKTKGKHLNREKIAREVCIEYEQRVFVENQNKDIVNHALARKHGVNKRTINRYTKELRESRDKN